jgi:hypothetical protein
MQPKSPASPVDLASHPDLRVTKRDVATILDVCPRTVDNLISRGALPAHRIEGMRAVRVRLGDVLAIARGVGNAR